MMTLEEKGVPYELKLVDLSNKPDWFLEKRTTLPVWQQKEEFLNALKANQTLILVGETGSGKTTQTAVALGAEVDNKVPEHDYSGYFGPGVNLIPSTGDLPHLLRQMAGAPPLTLRGHRRYRTKSSSDRDGIQQRKNCWQDEVLGTKCPILPGWNWTYQFQIKDQIGSFFCFPSVGLQRAAGEQVELDEAEETMVEDVEYEEVEEEVEEEEEEEVVEGPEEKDEITAANGTAADASAAGGDDMQIDDERKKHSEFLALPPHGSEVYIGGILDDVTEEDLKKFCEPAGEVTEIRVMKGENSSQNKGYAFVTFRTKELAAKVVEDLNDTELKLLEELNVADVGGHYENEWEKTSLGKYIHFFRSSFLQHY